MRETIVSTTNRAKVTITKNHERVTLKVPAWFTQVDTDRVNALIDKTLNEIPAEELTYTLRGFVGPWVVFKHPEDRLPDTELFCYLRRGNRKENAFTTSENHVLLDQRGEV